MTYKITGLSPAAIARLNAVLVETAASPEIAARLRAIGVEPYAADAAAFRAFVAREAATWRPLIRDLGIRLDG